MYKRTVSVIGQYLSDMLSITISRVFTLFEVLGIILFFQPKFAPNLVALPDWSYTFVAVAVLILFLSSNFVVYSHQKEKLTNCQEALGALATADSADIRIASTTSNLSICFPDGSGHVETLTRAVSGDRGFYNSGLPACAKLLLSFTMENHGKRAGKLRLSVNKEKTNLPNFLQYGNDSTTLYGEVPTVPNGESRSATIRIVFPLDSMPIRTFIYKLLDAKDREYHIVLNCYTVHSIGPEHGPIELKLVVDFNEFYSDLKDAWIGQDRFKEQSEMLKRIAGL